MASTIIFDFDGTVAVGLGPVLAYAREMARFADEEFLSEVLDTIARFDAGEQGSFRDGYDIVGTLATQAGISAADRQHAYLTSRAQLGTAAAEPVAAAPGLADILDQLPDDVRVILATNAPEPGVETALAAWGVREHFDEIVFNTGKPAGLTPVVEHALAHGPVLAVGDIVENDLAPASALGADTALVGATAATSTAEVTMRGAALIDLSAAILAWATSASSSVRTTTPAVSER